MSVTETVARPSKPRPHTSTFVGAAVALAFTVYAAWKIDFSVFRPIFENWSAGSEIVGGFFPPNWSYIWRVWDAWLETFAIAVIASFFGVLVGLVLAFMASKVTNRSTWLFQAIRWGLSVLRSLPDIAYVLIFVAIVGVGSLAGMLALFVFNIGIAAKLTSETIDAIDPGPLEAADASGAGTFNRSRWAVMPQILPAFLSYSLYIFELNIRASVVIGLGGGGGIGSAINSQIDRLSLGYANVSALVIALVAIVFAIDLLSQYTRRRFV